MGNKIAQAFTDAMATWTFIFGILIVCISSITLNALGLVHYDPTMIVLNTILSLWAAVQGSIIMINGNQIAKEQAKAQLARDDMQLNQTIMMEKILELEQHLLDVKENQNDQAQKAYVPNPIRGQHIPNS